MSTHDAVFAQLVRQFHCQKGGMAKMVSLCTRMPGLNSQGTDRLPMWRRNTGANAGANSWLPRPPGDCLLRCCCCSTHAVCQRPACLLTSCALVSHFHLHSSLALSPGQKLASREVRQQREQSRKSRRSVQAAAMEMAAVREEGGNQ